MKSIIDFLKKSIPGLKKMTIYSAWVVFLYSVFFLTYMPTNRFNAYRANYCHMYFSWETGIPMIPEFMVFYVSIVFVFGLPLFLLKISDIHLMGFRFLVNMLASTAIFLIVPTINGFDRTVPDGIFQGTFGFLFNADKPHNLFPSLHISFSATLALGMMKLRSNWIKGLFLIWLILVSVSVVAVHQHHLADIAGGIALSWGSMKFVTKTPAFFENSANKIYLFVRKNGRRPKKVRS